MSGASGKWTQSKGGKAGKGKFQGQRFYTCSKEGCDNWDTVANILKNPFCTQCGTKWPEQKAPQGQQAKPGEQVTGANATGEHLDESVRQILQEVATTPPDARSPDLASRAAAALGTQSGTESTSDDNTDDQRPLDHGTMRRKMQRQANAAQWRLQKKEWAYQRQTASLEYHRAKAEEARAAAEQLAEEVAHAQEEYDRALVEQRRIEKVHEKREEDADLRSMFEHGELDEDPELLAEFKALTQRRDQRRAERKTLKQAEDEKIGEEDEDMDEEGPESSEAAPRPGGAKPMDDDKPPAKKPKLTPEERTAKVDAELQCLQEDRAKADGAGSSYDFRPTYQDWRDQGWNKNKWHPRKPRTAPYGPKWGTGKYQQYW